MTIDLYMNNSPPNYVNKTIVLVSSLSGHLREPSSVIDPVITIQSASPTGFNYAYISEFQRYFYITGISSDNANLVTIAMHVDVLMTYKTNIRATSAIIKRQETQNNRYLDDHRFKAYQNPKHKILQFPNGFHDFSYILTLAGNGQTII